MHNYIDSVAKGSCRLIPNEDNPSVVDIESDKFDENTGAKLGSKVVQSHTIESIDAEIEGCRNLLEQLTQLKADAIVIFAQVKG